MPVERSLRAFFAISLPKAGQKQLHHTLQQCHIDDHSHALRWTKPYNLHVTLRFIAKILPAQLPILIHKVEQQLQEESPFTITFEHLHFFPNAEKAKVLAMYAVPQTILLHLSQRISGAMQSCGLSKDEREFIAHLTLARFRHHGLPSLQTYSTEKISHRVHEVVLFESRPSEHGSLYLPLHAFVLRGKKVDH
jgi:2'-5' RNA ligase